MKSINLPPLFYNKFKMFFDYYFSSVVAPQVFSKGITILLLFQSNIRGREVKCSISTNRKAKVKQTSKINTYYFGYLKEIIYLKFIMISI